MGSSAIIVRVEEMEVLAPVPEDRRFDAYGQDRNLLDNRVKDAAYRMWHGHDVYDNPVKFTAITPNELSQNALDSVDSYNFTPIVPLMNTADYEIKVKNVTVILSGSEWDNYMNPNYDPPVINPKIMEIHPELNGLIVSASVQVPGIEEKNLWRTKKSDGWKVVSTVDADTSGGKTKSVFELVINGRPVDGEYETQALARAEATQRMKDDLDISKVRVTSRTVREDGSDLVSLKRKVTSATAKIAVSYVKVNKDTPRRDGFLVQIRYRD